MGRLADLRTPRLRGRAAWLASLVAFGSGVIFVTFGVGHFANHGNDVAEFRRYEVPFADPAVWGVGVLELVGGVALILGLLVRPGAIALAGDMVGVIATAGRVAGGPVNLGLAPLLLTAMVFLVWAGPGVLSIDVCLRRRSQEVQRLGTAPS